MIKINNLSKIFYTEEIETTALKDINLNVSQGDFMVVMGPSGCGKSSLLSILGMLDSPTSGDYVYLGENIANSSENELANKRKQDLGFVFQSFNLIDELPLKYQHVGRAERLKRTEEILKQVGLDHRANHFPQHLSGGQQQRVSIARALVINPKLILADEPTGNLDSKNGEDVMQMLRQLNQKGTTIIMVTHSENDAHYGNRVLRIFDGQVISDEAQLKTAEVSYA